MVARRFCSDCCSAAATARGGFLRLRLLALGGFAGAGGFGGGIFEEAAVLFEFAGEGGELLACLGEVVGAGGKAGGEFGDAVGVGGGAGGDALEFDGGLVGLGSGFADLLVERVAVADAFGVLGVHGFDGGGLRVDLGGEERDLFRGGGLLGVELGHAAGEDDAEAGAELVAEGAVTLGLGGLALERVHLAGDFFEDVVDAGEVLAGGFEAEFGEALLGLEASDAGGLFEDGAAVEGLGAEELADALLADDGVGLAAEAGAHEDVLNVAEAADFPLRRYSESPLRKRRRVMVSSPARTGARPNLRRRILRTTLFGLASSAAASASVGAGTMCGPLASPSMMVPGWASATASSVSSACCWRRVVSSQSVGWLRR